MEREIKFRAYVSKDSRYNVKVGMINSESIKEMLQDKLTKIPAEWTWSEIGLVMMQFTGLKDKNGKEIYEGDILKDRIIVTWREDLASFALMKEGWAHDHYFGEAVDAGNTEIIGNIHENENLLTI